MHKREVLRYRKTRHVLELEKRVVAEFEDGELYIRDNFFSEAEAKELYEFLAGLFRKEPAEEVAHG